MRRTTLVGLLATVALVVGAPSAGAITNGQPDGNRHPEVGALVGYFPSVGQTFAYCSGTLISPTVFLTAAHCGFLGTPTVQVTFDEKYTSTSTLYTGAFYADPDWNPNGDNSQSSNNPDIAVVVFTKAIKGITPAQLPGAGLLDQMKAAGTLNQSTEFTSVGYGDSQFTNGPGGQTTTHLQARNYAVGLFKSLTAAYLSLTQNSAQDSSVGGTCNGDSGGPNFLGAGANETPIIAGATITGDTYCKATNVDFRLDTPTARAFLGNYVTLP